MTRLMKVVLVLCYACIAFVLFGIGYLIVNTVPGQPLPVSMTMMWVGLAAMYAGLGFGVWFSYLERRQRSRTVVVHGAYVPYIPGLDK